MLLFNAFNSDTAETMEDAVLLTDQDSFLATGVVDTEFTAEDQERVSALESALGLTPDEDMHGLWVSDGSYSADTLREKVAAFEGFTLHDFGPEMVFTATPQDDAVLLMITTKQLWEQSREENPMLTPLESELVFELLQEYDMRDETENDFVYFGDLTADELIAELSQRDGLTYVQ